jgi:hypothetical protein
MAAGIHIAGRSERVMSDQGSMRRYLLGTAKPEERSDFENRYLSDAGVFDELVEAENDLIDDYARGQLSETERQEFERRYLSSEKGRARVQYAAALAELSREPRLSAGVEKGSLWLWLSSPFAQPNRTLRLGLAGITAAILIIGSLKLATHRRLDASLASERTSRPQSSTAAPRQGGQTPTEIAKARSPELVELTVQLSPGIARGAGSRATVVTLQSRASSITFRLTLEEDSHPAYVAVLETAEGQLVQRSDKLKSRLSDGSKVVDLPISSGLVRPGDYVIRLQGTGGTKISEEEVEAYTFRAVSK